MPSFDIVSEVDSQEVRNAKDNAERELTTRFDFRGVEATFELTGDSVKLTADAEFQLTQMVEMLSKALVKRGVDVRSMEVDDVVHHGKQYYLVVKMQQGIEQLTSKKLVKIIKESKIKVQAAIQGEQLRITGKKRDDLQATMALVREQDLGQPFQFTNFRD